jgi:LPS O-antigen subunit length determinant protein (WzzB/FepE family)
MLEVRPPYDNEIDLFEVFETIWAGKWLVSAFVAISFLLGSSFYIIKTPIYISNIVHSVGLSFPYYERTSLVSKFRETFYSKRIFNLWKSENKTSKIVYEDFSFEKIVNGFQFANKPQDLSAYFLTDKKKVLSKLVIKTKELSVINDYFKYIKFVNKQLTTLLVLEAKNELNLIKRSVGDRQSLSLKESPEIMLNRFINFSSGGSKLFIVRPPTFPEKISPKIIPILALSIVLGGIIGVLFVLLKNTIRKRKESSSKM